MKVSFVIPSYNAAAWLPLAVRSALEQTHKDIEVVVVDDASADSTPDYLAWLEAQKDARVQVIRLPENRGRSAARNAGNAAANGEVICVLDADDLATPNRAVVTLAKMERTKARFVYGGARIIDAIGNASGEVLPEPFDEAKARKTLLNGVIHSTVAYTKTLAESVRYPESPELAALGLDDWAHQWEVVKAGYRMEAMPTVVCAYRMLSTGISKTRDPEQVKVAKTVFLDGQAVAS